MEPSTLTPSGGVAVRPGLTAEAPAPSNLLGSFNELLTNPTALTRRADSAGALGAHRLLLGALVCFALYGAASGFFQGGSQVFLAAFKAPLILVLSFVLCLPSLFVFAATSGVRWSSRRLLASAAGFAGTLGLLLLGLLPIAWLFSVSSRFLATVVWLHVIFWVLAVGFGWRFLGVNLREMGARGGMLLWLVLYCIVSFQVATFLRPVLWRDPGSPLFVSTKLFFIEQLGEVNKVDERHTALQAGSKGQRPDSRPATP